MRRGTELFDAVIVAAVIFVGQWQHDALVSLTKDLAPGVHPDTMLGLLSAIVTLILVALVHTNLDSFAWTRRRFHNLGSFEGVWAQVISQANRPFSIGFIEYNADQQSFQYYGFGYGLAEMRSCLFGNGREAAHWRADQLLLDTQRKALFFYSQDADATEGTGRQRLRNVGELYYRSRTDGRLTGQVYDLADDKPSEPFTIDRMIRITPRQIRRVLKGRPPTDHRDYVLLLLHVLRDELRLHALTQELLSK